MKTILKFLIIRLTFSLASSTFEAFNISCINSTFLVDNPNNSTLYISLPTFYRATLNIDLRHIASDSVLSGVSLFLYINNTDMNSSYTENIPLSISSVSFNLFASNNLVVSANFIISGNSSEQILGKSYIFSQSVSFLIVEANPQGKAQQSFLFIVSNTDLVSLPYNMISNTNANNFDGYFLSQVNTMSSMYSRQTSIPSYSDYWNGLQSVALPYVPYLSNCINQGDYIYFSQLIHNQSYCKLYGDNASPINQFSFGSTAQADNCQFTTKCMYDQIPKLANQYPFWQTLGTIDSKLFSITATELSQDSLLASFDTTDLVPCKIKSTGGLNSSGLYPLKVSMNFGYYQQTSTQRRMTTCQIEYSLYTTSYTNFTYQLDINVFPLSHTQILLNFGFKWYIYMLVFIMIGLVSNLQFIIFWCYHLIVTIKETRNFNIKIYLKLQKEILCGVLPAGIIAVVLTFLVEIIMNGTFFGDPLTNSTPVWNNLINDNIGYFASNIQSSTQSGRMGFSSVIVASYLIYVLSDSLIGKQRKKEEYEVYEVLGRKFKPQEWNRGKFLFVTLAYMFFSIYFLFFTYTTVFAQQIWFIIAFMQAFQMIIEEVVYSILDDKLPCTCLKLILGVLAYLATMGAIDLYYFILGYLVDVGISIIEITYLSQLQEGVKDYIQEKIEDIQKYYSQLMNDEDEDEQKKSKNQQQDSKNDQISIYQELNQINFLQKEIEEEHIDIDHASIKIYDQDLEVHKKFIQYLLQKEKSQRKEQKKKRSAEQVNQQELEQEKKQFENKKFELIIDGATGMAQYLVQPVVVLILWITYNTSTILNNFQISSQNAILYLLSSVILATFFQIDIMIIFHVLQLYLNTDYEHQFKQLLGRFQRKETFWITDEEYREQNLQIKLRGIHKYGISSQLFFVLTLYTISVFLFINGVMTIISAHFNIFKDPYIILIFIFWMVILNFLTWLLKKVATWFDIWGYATYSQANRQQTKFEEALSSFEQQTNEILRKQDFINSSTIKFTFKKINDPIERFEDDQQEEKKKIVASKLTTMSKKLQAQFDKEDFRLNFARKNKDFIRQHIQKILPLVKSFPQDDTAWIGKGNSVDDKDIKKQTKNCDPTISDFLTVWIKKVESNRAKRQEEGIQHQRRLKKCRFCFKTWGLYYGYGGICLECSNELFKQEQDKKDK